MMVTNTVVDVMRATGIHSTAQLRRAESDLERSGLIRICHSENGDRTIILLNPTNGSPLALSESDRDR
jgi:hypothetical protein